MTTAGYDPFAHGPLTVGTRTLETTDAARGRSFPCDLWYPDAAGPHPLVAYSHHAGGSRRVASLLCTHLASHGYVVAALDHSEVTAPELTAGADETAAAREERIASVIS